MIHTVHIDKIIHGGHGLGRMEDGIVVLTPFVLPGEKVEVKELKRKRSYMLAEPQNILQSSPERVDPPCPFYTICGGCDLQHMSMKAQHTTKEQILKESLDRAGVTVYENIIHPVIPSPKSFHYRHRIRLQVSSNGSIGFYQAGSNNIVDIDYCHVATDIINKALAELRQSSLLRQIAPKTKEIEIIQSPADNRVYCILHPASKMHFPKKTVVAHSSSLTLIDAIAIKVGKNVEIIVQDKNNGVLSQDFDASVCGSPYSLTWSPGCFSQVNARQNEGLIRLVCQLAAINKDQTVLDLFCGMGNFSIPLSIQGSAVLGIERHTDCIEHAQNSASRSGLNNSRFLDRDVHKWISREAKRSNEYNVIILDPPRQGMGNNIVQLAELAPSKIIYISCDPATLARDIALLYNKRYVLTSITPVDMFPQTHHIESVALLEKN